MRALYFRRPPAAEMVSLGLRPSDFPEPHVELWPENWPPIQLFSRFSTQWRAGAGGPYGLDYGVFFHVLDRMRIPDDEYETMVDALRLIEGVALEEMDKESR